MNNVINNQFSDSKYTAKQLLAVVGEWWLNECPRDDHEAALHEECGRLAELLGDSPEELLHRLHKAVYGDAPRPQRRLLAGDHNYELWSPLASDPGINTGIEIARRYGDAILGLCCESMARRDHGDGELMIAVVLEDDSIMPMYRHTAEGWVEF